MARAPRLGLLALPLLALPLPAQEALPSSHPLEERLLSSIDTGRLRAWHDLTAGEPHDAGTAGDRRLIEGLAAAFAEMGLEVERQPIWTWLAEPVSARVEVLAPERIELPVREAALEDDPLSAHPDLRFGWNAYSGSGVARGEVVYANRGRKEDFEELAELGVDCAGKIVVARYGGNYRGYKAKYAEEAGAAGLLIYTDPRDSGWARGLPWPEGGWANGSSIQRGSIKTLPYDGDPLTPFVAATEDAPRLDPESLALPTIPVQPLGWDAAREVLGRMRGESAPQAWQGGLPFRYRLTGGPGLVVEMEVRQERKLVRTENVVGVLRGAEEPDRLVVLGAHHDAWGFGASDPACGLICVLEAANVWSEAAAAGHRPRRSIAFAAWAAEEHGIIGSVEWVEGRLEELLRSGVAYVNLDMAATGTSFRASAVPALQRAIADAAGAVPQPGTDGTVLDDWIGRGTHATDAGLPRFGDVGGGSDHVGFLALAGMPVCGLGAGGSDGSAYHSAYDHLGWYRRVVGDDYEGARLVTGVAAVLAARLADDPLVALELARTGPETVRHLEAITGLGRGAGLLDGDEARPVAPRLARIEAAALRFGARARELEGELREAAAGGALGPDGLARANAALLSAGRAWLSAEGMPGRPWYRNLWAAPDETSGYAAWTLPLLRHAVEHADAAALERAELRTLGAFERLDDVLGVLAELLPGADR